MEQRGLATTCPDFTTGLGPLKANSGKMRKLRSPSSPPKALAASSIREKVSLEHRKLQGSRQEALPTQPAPGNSLDSPRGSWNNVPILSQERTGFLGQLPS